MSGPFELAPGSVVRVSPPTVPSLAMAPPVSTAVAVLPVAGPPGPPGVPGLPGDAVNLAHLHTQDAPSTVWLIVHTLPFPPAAVDVIDHTGVRHHPDITWPDAATVRLTFLTDVRGTARLS